MAGALTETAVELKLKILACVSIQRLIGGIHRWNLAQSGRRGARPLVAGLQFPPCRCLEVFFTPNRSASIFTSSLIPFYRCQSLELPPPVRSSRAAAPQASQRRRRRSAWRRRRPLHQTVPALYVTPIQMRLARWRLGRCIRTGLNPQRLRRLNLLNDSSRLSAAGTCESNITMTTPACHQSCSKRLPQGPRVLVQERESGTREVLRSNQEVDGKGWVC